MSFGQRSNNLSVFIPNSVNMKTEQIREVNQTLLDYNELIKHLKAHLDSACKCANYAAKAGDNRGSRKWSDRAQNLRRVLVDYEALPRESL